MFPSNPDANTHPPSVTSLTVNRSFNRAGWVVFLLVMWAGFCLWVFSIFFITSFEIELMCFLYFEVGNYIFCVAASP